MVVSLFTGMSYMLATNNILELGVLYLTPLSTTVQFSLIKVVGFIGGGNHRHASSDWQSWLHNFVSSTPRHERDSNS